MVASSDKREKSVLFIARLLRLTQDGTIEWDPVPAPRGSNETAYETALNDRKLRLYRFDEEVMTWAGWEAANTLPHQSIYAGWPSEDAPKKRIVRSTVLEVLVNGLVTYTFRDTTGLGDLYESAAYKASKVEHLMDSVLSQA
jgi:hypothetical protein